MYYYYVVKPLSGLKKFWAAIYYLYRYYYINGIGIFEYLIILKI